MAPVAGVVQDQRATRGSVGESDELLGEELGFGGAELSDQVGHQAKHESFCARVGVVCGPQCHADWLRGACRTQLSAWLTAEIG